MSMRGNTFGRIRKQYRREFGLGPKGPLPSPKEVYGPIASLFII